MEEKGLLTGPSKRYPGLTCFENGVRQIPIESIPGVLESGWSPGKNEAEKKLWNHADLQSRLKKILKELQEHENAWPFAQAVSADEVPEYYEHIKFPMGKHIP